MKINIMSPIDSEMNQGWIPNLFGCHGLIEICGYPGIEKVSWSQQVLCRYISSKLYKKLSLRTSSRDIFSKKITNYIYEVIHPLFLLIN